MYAVVASKILFVYLLNGVNAGTHPELVAIRDSSEYY